MRRNYHKIFEITKIKQQILRIFLLAAILPILILGTFSVVHLRNQMSDHYRSQVKADGLRINSILFDITTSIYTSTESILNNKGCMKLFGSDYSSDTDKQYFKDINSSLTTFRKNTAAISSVHIYTDNENIPSEDYISSLPNYDNQNWYLKSRGWSTWTCLTSQNRFNNEVYELALIRKIGIISDKYTAYLVICLDNNYLKNRIEQNDYQIMTTVDNSPIFYSSDTSLVKTQMPVPDDYNGLYYTYTGPLTIKNRTALTNILTFRPYKTDNLFLINVSDFSAYESINHMTLQYVIIILVAIIVPTSLIFLFSSYFSGRITTLKRAMHQARIGDYNIIDTFQGDDELVEIFQDLKATVQMIHDKEAQFYKAQINEQQLINRQQKMEFKMLASQINPHFLYNTLETIRMQALSSGNRDVATSIKLLGKSMHYVLENTGTSCTTLTKELDYVRTYLSIQQLRFGDRVNVTFQIQEDLDTDEYKILPLLLQPIVENAIIHGLDNINENGHITISITTQDSNLIITISDNGIGMDADSLDILNSSINNHNPNDSRSIGLYNIRQRIHLFYGEEYNMEISSCLNQGTTVTLKLPRSYTN
jgi:two-component system, sensor histidine kinase YesM